MLVQLTTTRSQGGFSWTHDGCGCYRIQQRERSHDVSQEWSDLLGVLVRTGSRAGGGPKGW